MNDSINNIASKSVTPNANTKTSQEVSVSTRQNTADESGNTVPQKVLAVAEKKPSTAEELNAVVEDLNSQVQFVERNLQFSVDDNSGQTVVKVVNTLTDELIRQIPSEDILRISERLKEQQETNIGVILEISA